LELTVIGEEDEEKKTVMLNERNSVQKADKRERVKVVFFVGRKKVKSKQVL
jgi:hypothetical protein